jgi:hypothetical protein
MGERHGLQSHVSFETQANSIDMCKDACINASPACKAATFDQQNSKCLIHSVMKDEVNRGNYQPNEYRTYMEPRCQTDGSAAPAKAKDGM